jgi:hypothetical protein
MWIDRPGAVFELGIADAITDSSGKRSGTGIRTTKGKGLVTENAENKQRNSLNKERIVSKRNKK